MSADERAARGHAGITALAFGALGIVYGDIGTSPLYAFRESFEHADLDVTQANAYGVASIVFWALIVIISIKYLALVMRADNHGEGGILALTALLLPKRGLPTGAKRAIIALGVFGTALLYGDGLITPAISVLSAVEGFEVATTAFESWVIPVAVTILVVLFLVQRRGTERISRVFGPVMIVWFVVIGVLGLRQIVAHPSVLRAIVAHLRRRVVRRTSRARRSWRSARSSSSSPAARRCTPTWATSAVARSSCRGTRSCCPPCCSTTSARPRCWRRIPERRSGDRSSASLRTGRSRRSPCWRRWPP